MAAAGDSPISQTLPPNCKFIDTLALISDTISELYQIQSLRTLPPALYIDLEGYDLCRLGRISTVQIYSLPTNTTYLIDVHTLGKEAFDTPGLTGLDKTLKSLLTDSKIPKVFFDCRNDHDALLNLFQVTLDGVHDVQLMELATRKGSKRLFNGLAKVIRDYANLSDQELQQWTEAKEKGKTLFVPEKGGDWGALEKRPLDQDLLSYIIQDVTILPRLWKLFDNRLSPKWRSKVENEVFWRLQLARQPQYFGANKNMMTLGPW